MCIAPDISDVPPTQQAIAGDDEKGGFVGRRGWSNELATSSNSEPRLGSEFTADRNRNYRNLRHVVTTTHKIGR